MKKYFSEGNFEMYQLEFFCKDLIQKFSDGTEEQYPFALTIDAKFNLDNYDDPKNKLDYISDKFYQCYLRKKWYEIGDDEYYEWRDKIDQEISNKLPNVKKALSEFGEIKISNAVYLKMKEANQNDQEFIYGRILPYNYGKIPTMEELADLLTEYGTKHFNIEFKNFTKITSEKWKTLSENERKKQISIVSEKIADRLIEGLDTKEETMIGCWFCLPTHSKIGYCTIKINNGEKTISNIHT